MPFPGRQVRRQGLPAAQQARGGRCAGAPPAGSVHDRAGREQADRDAARGALHHLDAAAGRFDPPRLRGAQDDDAGAAALRGRPHHLHADRFHQPVAGGGGRRARPRRVCVRSALPAEVAERLRQQGRGPGGARGDPADGRGRATRGAGHCGRRRPPVVRPDPAPVHRLPDDPGGVHEHHRDGRGRCVRASRPRARAPVRRVHPRPAAGVPQGRPDRRTGLRAGRAPGVRQAGGGAALHQAAPPVQRSEPGAGTGEARHRAAVDLRLESSPRSRIAATSR